MWMDVSEQSTYLEYLLFHEMLYSNEPVKNIAEPWENVPDQENAERLTKM